MESENEWKKCHIAAGVASMRIVKDVMNDIRRLKGQDANMHALFQKIESSWLNKLRDMHSLPLPALPVESVIDVSGVYDAPNPHYRPDIAGHVGRPKRFMTMPAFAGREMDALNYEEVGFNRQDIAMTSGLGLSLEKISRKSRKKRATATPHRSQSSSSTDSSPSSQLNSHPPDIPEDFNLPQSSTSVNGDDDSDELNVDDIEEIDVRELFQSMTNSGDPAYSNLNTINNDNVDDGMAYDDAGLDGHRNIRLVFRNDSSELSEGKIYIMNPILVGL